MWSSLSRGCVAARRSPMPSSVEVLRCLRTAPPSRSTLASPPARLGSMLTRHLATGLHPLRERLPALDRRLPSLGPSVASSPASYTARALSSSAAGFESTVSAEYYSSVDMASKLKKEKERRTRRRQGGIISIKNTWNNTIVNISDLDYKTKANVSGGTVGFKKSKRASVFAMEKVMVEAFTKARSLGMRKVMISMTGPAITLRKPLVKTLREEAGLRIMKIRASDNVPHGGCRARKSKRRRYRTKAKRR